MLRFCLTALALSTLLASNPLAQTATTSKEKVTAPVTIVNLNTASASELEALPGVGPKVAARIVEYRQKKGPFKKIEELMNVQGIGEKSFLKLRAQLTVAPSKPDASTQQ